MVPRPLIDRRQMVAAAAALTLAAGPALAQSGRPLLHDTSLTLASGREVPLLVARPGHDAPCPLLIFSHGANSSPAKYQALIAPLAAAGFVVAAPVHMDSPDHPGGGRVDPAQSMALRLEDMRGLIAQPARLGAEPGPVAAAGHSYGALIAQLLIGARVAAPGTGPDPLDDAVDLALAFSPPGPFPPSIGPDTWKTVRRPMLVQTGTADIIPPIAPSWEAHRLSHDTSPSPSVLFIGEDVDHYFGNLIGRPEREAVPRPVQLEGAIATALALIRAVRTGQRLDQAIPSTQPLARIEIHAGARP